MTDADYRTRIMELLHTRGPEKTICPSEVLGAEDKQNAGLMEQVRATARVLASEQLIDFTQRGRIVDPLKAKGPIRLRLKR